MPNKQNSAYNTNPEDATSEKKRPDLFFHPATYSTNKLLHEKDIEHYNTQGYLKGIRIFAKDEADNLRDYFDKLLSQVMANGGNSYSFDIGFNLKPISVQVFGPLFFLVLLVSLVLQLNTATTIFWSMVITRKGIKHLFNSNSKTTSQLRA